MRQALDTAPTPSAVSAVPHIRSSSRINLLEIVGLALVSLVSIAIRLPYLWDVPRYTDELQEVSWSLTIARGEQLPLTAVDSYYGPLWSYFLALLFVLVGPSPELPRLTAMLLAVVTVILTYVLAKEIAGRWPAMIALGLMVTSGGHVIINSHTARSNSITPLLTTAAILLIYLALSDRRWDAASNIEESRKVRPWLLVPAGLLLGLSLQTHLSVIALLPGIALYALLKGRHLLNTRWPYLAALATVVGYLNMIVYNLLTGFWSFRHARSLQEGYTDGRTGDPSFYTSNLQSLVQSLSRLLSGTIDVPDSPSRFLYIGLALAGMALLARRPGGALLLLSTVSMVFILPYFNPRYGPILSGRYLIPLLPLAFLAIGSFLVVMSRLIVASPILKARVSWQPLAIVLGLILAAFPLWRLSSYYDEVLADARTNAPLHTLTNAIVQGRQPDELVLLDEGLAQEQLGAGGTDLKAFRMLLGTRSIPYTEGKATEADELLEGRTSMLLVIEAKKRSQVRRELAVTPLSREVESASGSEHRYAVYRVARP